MILSSSSFSTAVALTFIKQLGRKCPVGREPEDVL
jgi:hypothetical protein